MFTGGGMFEHPARRRAYQSNINNNKDSRARHHQRQSHHQRHNNQNQNNLNQAGPVVMMIVLWFVLVGFSGFSAPGANEPEYSTYRTRKYSFEQ